MSKPPAWIDIPANDAEASRAFYRHLLGWEIHVDVDESISYGLVQPGPEGYPAASARQAPKAPSVGRGRLLQRV